MAVTFHIPGPLREFAAHQSTVHLHLDPGANLASALHSLFLQHPGLRDRVLTESGELRRHVNIFLGNENIRYTGGLTTPLPIDCEISIVPAISGGCFHSAPPVRYS
jgi:molybdopterin synthase sulfur carrier subunit